MVVWMTWKCLMKSMPALLKLKWMSMVSKSHGFSCSRTKPTTTQQRLNHLVGAATCIGGAIRDPLSRGAPYVYQAMRISGAGDITAPISETRAGKLPQQVIS